jgi:hypothetical protein
MSGETKAAFLEQLAGRYGRLQRLPRSHSLYDLGDGAARVYIRYSKVHHGDRTFYGLRDIDLRRLQGHPSIICFLWDGQREPLLVPFSQYEDVFETTSPAADGQYKAQVYLKQDSLDLYIAGAGRFNVEGHLGWEELQSAMDSADSQHLPSLSHAQVQTLLGAIGTIKRYDVWIPTRDQANLDWSMADPFGCRDLAPQGYEPIGHILQEVDVLWIRKGSNDLAALFEVEHSTPVYSGLLRFNDIRLVAPALEPTFAVVADDSRRSQFVRQVNRPTFQASGLNTRCSFLTYLNVFTWHRKLRN